MKLFTRLSDDEFVGAVRRNYSRRTIIGWIAVAYGLTAIAASIYLWWRISTAIASMQSAVGEAELVENVSFLTGVVYGKVLFWSIASAALGIPIGLHMVLGRDRKTELLLRYFPCEADS